MTKSFAKISSWLSAFAVLLCTAALAGDLKVTYEIVQPCVPGVTGYSQAVIDLYVTTGTENYLTNLTAFLAPIEGVTIDPEKVEWHTDTIVGPTAKYTATTNNGRLRLMIQNAVGAKSIEASAEAQYLCRVYADVDNLLAGQTVSLPFTFQNATGVNVATSAGANFRDWLSNDSITSVDFNVYKSFNFFLAKGATFETDEDTALTIDAADPEKFEATAWDTATSSLVATTDVEFTGTATIEPTDAGSIEIKNGKLVFTPAKDWNGEVSVSATAKSKTIADTDTAVSFTITVNPVDDPLVVEWESQELVGVEGDAVSGTFTLIATDVDGDKFLTGATVTLGDDFLTVEGTLEQQGSQGGVTTYLFTATGPVVPYTAVPHPSTSWDCPLTVVATDGTTEYELTGTVSIADTDQLIGSADFAVNGNSQALEVTADATLTAEGSAIDPDEEDEATVAVQWSEDGQTWGTTQPTLAKGMIIYAKGVATSSYALKAYSVDSATVTITVTNSAPVVPVTNGSVFVLRHEDKSKPDDGVTTFTATDADGLDDLLLCAEPTRSAEPAASTEIELAGIYGDAIVAIANGTITFTYTVKPSTVEDGEDTFEDLAFYVTDKSEEDFIPVTVNCTYQENPPPVLTAAATEVTVTEVDADGNPTAFEVTVTATDTSVYPAGVGSWAITVPDGWTAEAGEQDTGSVESGTWEGSATWTITTAGYDTITGAPRASSAEFGFTVTAVDVATSAEATLDFTATVTDVDRLPSAPATVALEPAEPVHGDAITATPAGATDEDGDEITGYTYAWAYSADGESFTDLAETSDILNDAEAIKKGYTVKVTAFAFTKPYADVDLLAVSEEGAEATVVVGNTAPYMSTLGDQEAADATVNLEYTWTVTENSEDNAMTAVATDVDVADGVDSLTYSVSEIDETVGTLTIDEATGAITFTPATDYNTVETGDVVTFTVSATDESDAVTANTATVTLVITEVNSAPSLAIDDQYELPGDLGVEQTVTATAEMGDNEDAQEISEANVAVVENEDDIFEVAPAVAFEGKEVTITYTIKADAPLGATAKLKVTIKDNGTTAGEPDPMEAEAEFTIFLGASPWYPILSFECADPENHTEGHTVVIDGSDNSTYSITLKGATYEVLPADYVAIGHPGYEPGTELTITVYPWTLKEGTSTEECAATTAAVADYVAPSEATTDGETELTTDENGFVELSKFSVPMAKSYTVVVKKDGVEVQTIEDDFAPNDEGMVLPDVEGMTLQLTEAGEYTIEVSGASPAGESEAVVLFTVTSEGGEAIDLADEEWDGEFLPEDGAVLGNASVRFSWPALVGATSYELTVINGDGKEETFEVSGTSKVVELAMDADVVPYTWFVTATNSKGSKESGVFALVLSEALGDAFVITKVVADDNGLKIIYVGTLPEDDLFFSYQYFDVDFTDPSLAWTNGSGQATETAIEGLILPMVATSAGDFVVLKQGNGDWKIYEVQEP